MIQLLAGLLLVYFLKKWDVPRRPGRSHSYTQYQIKDSLKDKIIGK